MNKDVGMKKPNIKTVVIEDNPDDVLLLQKRLEPMNFNFEYEVFGKGEDAFRYLQQVPAGQEPPGLIFLDLGLPDENGLEFLKKIRQIPLIRSTPVIVVTASEEAEDVKQTYKLGGTFFLRKPWVSEVLKEAIVQLKITGRL